MQEKIQKILDVASDDDATRLKIVVSAASRCAKSYHDEPTAANLRDWDAAQKKSGEVVAELAEKYGLAESAGDESAGGSSAAAGNGGGKDSADGQEVGIGHKHQVRRQYTVSEAALEQRRDAAAQPREGLKGNRNAWKHGRYARNMLTRIKPCLSTCPKYPCELVKKGATAPGGDCLDAEELLSIIRSVHQMLSNPDDSADFLEISAVNIGNSLRILEMLQEDILRDGTIVRAQKYDKSGNIYQEEIKLHPSLYALPKMIADLNMTPEQFLMTPKAAAKNDNEEEAVKTIADLMREAGSRMSASRKDQTEDEDGAD